MASCFKILILFVVCCGVFSRTGAQTVTKPADSVKKAKPVFATVKPKAPKPISRELSFGLRLNSNGWSVYSDIGRMKPRDAKHADMFYNVRFWQIEITEKKHPKQYKIKSEGGGSGSNSYIYGKINNLYALKLGRGYMRMLAGKPDPGSVSIHWLYAGGFSLGMLKPYYLNVYSDPNAIKYDDGTKEDFLNQYLIQGGAGFAKGLGEMKYIPGFHIKSALHFDFSASRKSVIGVEAGFNAEYYTGEVKIMANQPATPLFLDLYVAIQVGKRW